MQPNRSKSFKQRLLRGHVAVGISVSHLLYVSIFFGMFAIFLPYIQVWEKPSRHFKTVEMTQVNYAPMLAMVTADPNFPKNNIIIRLPGYKNDPAVRISHQFVAETAFNPQTGERLQDEGKNSNLAGFLNGLHYGRPLKKIGFIIFGLASVAVTFLVIGGLMLIGLLKYKRAGQTQQSVFSYWHRSLLTWGAPVFLLVVLCGSAMCLSFDGSGPMTYLSTNGAYSNIRPVIGPILFPHENAVEKSAKKASMLPIKKLISIAQKNDPHITWQQLTLINWGDETARIKLEGYNPYKPFLNGITNKPTTILHAHDGSLIKNIKVLDRPWSVLLTDFFFSIHLLFGLNIWVRLVFFLIMLACCFATGFGVMLWLGKKARQFKDVIPFYHWLGKFSLSIMIGVIPAIGVLFNLQWLLPFDLPERLAWQQGLFFDTWLATLLWSFYRVNSYTAAKEFLFYGGLLFLHAPILHLCKSGFTPWDLWQYDLGNILAVDIGLALTGSLLVLLARKLPEDRVEAKDFWIRKPKRTLNA